MIERSSSSEPAIASVKVFSARPTLLLGDACRAPRCRAPRLQRWQSSGGNELSCEIHTCMDDAAHPSEFRVTAPRDGYRLRSAGPLPPPCAGSLGRRRPSRWATVPPARRGGAATMWSSFRMGRTGPRSVAGHSRRARCECRTGSVRGAAARGVRVRFRIRVCTHLPRTDVFNSRAFCL